MTWMNKFSTKNFLQTKLNQLEQLKLETPQVIKDEPASIKPKSSKLKEEPIKPPKLEEKQIHQGQDTSQEYSSDHSENEQSDDSSESISSNSNTEIGVPEKRKKWMEESENFIFYRAN